MCMACCLRVSVAGLNTNTVFLYRGLHYGETSARQRQRVVTGLAAASAFVACSLRATGGSGERIRAPPTLPRVLYWRLLKPSQSTP